MAKRYVYEHEEYEDTKEGRESLAFALVREEPGIYDEYDFELWVDSHKTASEILWEIKEYGYDDTYIELVYEFEQWYAEENCDDLLHDFSDSYETVDDEDKEEE